MKKALCLAVAGLCVMTQIVPQDPVCDRACLCDNGIFPCGECVNPAIQLLNEAETRCFICPGAQCETCSADYVCENFFECPDPSTQKPDIMGSQCVSCSIENCLNCFFPDLCQKCQPGYRLDNFGGCQLVPECNVQNCEICFTNRLAQCRVCAPGFYRDTSDKCSDQPCLVEGCLRCQAGNNFQCQTCDLVNGYKKVGTTCVLQCLADNCKSCAASSRTECAECKPGFGIHFTQTELPNCKKCFSKNCETCRDNSFTKCRICNQGFSPDRLGKCRRR